MCRSRWAGCISRSCQKFWPSPGHKVAVGIVACPSPTPPALRAAASSPIKKKSMLPSFLAGVFSLALSHPHADGDDLAPRIPLADFVRAWIATLFHACRLAGLRTAPFRGRCIAGCVPGPCMAEYPIEQLHPQAWQRKRLCDGGNKEREK